jgi:hypothetical protein
LEVLVKLLREEHLLKMVRKAYASIEYGKLKSLLGMGDANDAQFNDFLNAQGSLRVTGDGFVNP